MTILILAFIALNLVAMLLITWRLYAAICRQQRHELDFQLGILLHRIETELSMHDSRLVDRLRLLK